MNNNRIKNAVTNSDYNFIKDLLNKNLIDLESGNYFYFSLLCRETNTEILELLFEKRYDLFVTHFGGLLRILVIQNKNEQIIFLLNKKELNHLAVNHQNLLNRTIRSNNITLFNTFLKDERFQPDMSSVDLSIYHLRVEFLKILLKYNNLKSNISSENTTLIDKILKESAAKNIKDF
jgi:hypothetical protein